MNLWKQCFSLVIDAPSDHTHLCCIPKSSGRALNLALLVRAMEKVVTGLTQGDEVIRAITARLSRLDMMHIQDRVFGLAFTPLAAIRSEEHTSELQSPCNLVCRLLLEK